MATTRWRSSLANIEARLRRSLGIAGPIGLTLGDAPPLTPVVISDDATRPGAASDFRGRRFMLNFDIQVGAGGGGSTTYQCDAPNGVVLDTLMLSAVQIGGPFVPDVAINMMVHYQAIDMFPAGIGYGVVTRDGQMVDPMNNSADTAPILAGNSGAVAAVGMPIIRVRFNKDASPVVMPLALWLPMLRPDGSVPATHAARIAIGNNGPAPASMAFTGTIWGRVF